ncbi:MAG: ParB/RepB/Spo0J family partition protein [Rhodospirillales bacterium]|nr:ParB/RepB/Spo0J family partition protein [Rhodospirillales bacterium]
MNAIAPRAEPLIREIPLSRLALAPENVRRTPPDPLADAELRASIAAHGLLENLVARTADPGSEGGGFAVIAGGRRLRALQALAEEGVIEADHPVPCLVAADPDTLGELSLAENVVRIAMHPADQVVAFTKLTDAGQPVASVAARFGLSERLVEQRLRLGGVAPELLDAYRAGQIDLETLKAFSVTADHARQRTCWEQVAGQGYRPSAWQVKRILTEERVPGAAGIARYVGIEAYEAAGGTVLRDLFSRDDDTAVWFDDPALLRDLATAKLRIVADELATRWKWATPMVEVDWKATAHMGHIHPEPGEPTDEEKAEIERLHVRDDEIARLDEEDWTDAIDAEARAVDARLTEIDRAVDARAVWRPKDFRIAGCIATISQDGTLEVIEGLVRPEDMPKPEDGDGSMAVTGDGVVAIPGTGSDAGRIAGPAMSAPVSLPKDREAEARREAGVGVGLADDFRCVRTALVKAHLAGNFEAAFDLMLFQMARSVFRPGYTAHALDIAVRETADRPLARTNDPDFADWSPGEAMLADVSGLRLDWMEIEDPAESFAALGSLPEANKQALFAACVARTVKGQLAFEPQARPEFEATVARLGIDFAGHVRPTAGLYWSRIPKARILETARAVLGHAWTETRAKYRKAELAQAMEAAFAAGDRPVDLLAEAHAAALAWVPPGFAAFDAGRAGDGSTDSASAGAQQDADVSAAETQPAPDGAALEPEGDANLGTGDNHPDNGDAHAATGESPAEDADTDTVMPPVPMNGSGPAPDPVEIPAFLRHVH